MSKAALVVNVAQCDVNSARGLQYIKNDAIVKFHEAVDGALQLLNAAILLRMEHAIAPSDTRIDLGKAIRMQNVLENFRDLESKL